MKADTPIWTETALETWETNLPDGQWTILRDGFDWIALPPNGRSYPYALAAGLFRFGTIEHVKIAAHEASQFQLETLGRAELRKVRKRICQAGKIGLHRQFVVMSCGVKFDFRQALPDTTWGILWEGHGHSGALSAPSVSDLFNQIRTVFVPQRKVRVWPEGTRAIFLAENQRAMKRANIVEKLAAPVSEEQLDEEQKIIIDLKGIVSSSALKDLRQQDAIQGGSGSIPLRQLVSA